MKDNWLEIVNMERLVNFSRRLVFYNFDDKHADLDDDDFMDKISKIDTNTDDVEMDKLLPFDECETIFRPMLIIKIHKKTKKKSIFIEQEKYEDFLEQLNQRMVSNIVKGLVMKGVVESAFDNEKNDFVFWVKHKELDNLDGYDEAPETD